MRAVAPAEHDKSRCYDRRDRVAELAMAVRVRMHAIDWAWRYDRRRIEEMRAACLGDCRVRRRQCLASVLGPAKEQLHER